MTDCCVVTDPKFYTIKDLYSEDIYLVCFSCNNKVLVPSPYPISSKVMPKHKFKGIESWRSQKKS
jgi:hypothetical protein